MTIAKGREVPEQPAHLLQSMRIRGFRGFKDVSFPNFERINLITGKNNIGKTAALDAIFIQMGPNNPELMLRTNVFRGIDRFDADPEEIWGNFFYNRQIDKSIEITTRYSDLGQNTLKISLQSSNRSQITGRRNSSRLSAFATTQIKRDELIFEYRGVGGLQRSTATLDADGEIKYQRANIRNLRPGAYNGTRTRFPQEDAARFSKLERAGKEQEVVEIMQILEPRLRKLAVLFTGGTPLIHADIGTSELVAIPSMGEGMARMLSIVVGVAVFEEGVILIDEIENGLHYSVLEPIWRAIAESARHHNVQVFATTHSWECVRAAHQAFLSSSVYDFKLHRLEREDDEIRVIAFDQDTIDTSIDMNFEIR